MQQAIKDDLEADINNSTKCGVDALLKYFFSLVLAEDDPEKKHLNELQTKIEDLQSQHYYNLDGNGDTATRTDGPDALDEPAGTQRAATGGLQDTSDKKNVDPDDDTQFGSDEEKRLVKERDEILDALLHDVLDAVLPHANNQGVKDKLNAFAQQFNAQESARYGPYVFLCNDVFDRLTKLTSIGTNFRIRKPDDLDIRFHTNDTKPLISRYEDMPDLDRKLDSEIPSGSNVDLDSGIAAAATNPNPQVNVVQKNIQDAASGREQIIPCLNLKAMHRLGLETEEQGQAPAAPRSTVSLNLPQDLDGFWTNDGQNKNLAEVNVGTDVFLSHQSHCLAGRATLVFSAEGVTQGGSSLPTPMACKIYHPELQRRHEGQTLQVVHQIAEEHDREMVKHLPSMLFYGDVPGCTTQRIRSMVNRRWKGHRALRILGLKKLDKITSLQGANFIKAWLETLICHSFLWKNHVEHGDPSLSNIMYDPDEGCGVLSDFDLSLVQWEPRVVTDRTGTIPFMAIDLLIQGYWEGTTQRFYHHEMESFIWILAYVVLYDKGARKASPEVEAWRTSNYATCRGKKLNFYTKAILTKVKGEVQPSYQVYWPLVQKLCIELHFAHAQHDCLCLDSTQSHTDLPSMASEALWKLFTDALKSKSELLIKDIPDLPQLLGCLQLHKPSFSIPDPVILEGLQQKYHTDN